MLLKLRRTNIVPISRATNVHHYFLGCWIYSPRFRFVPLHFRNVCFRARILRGRQLSDWWNRQRHLIRFIVKLTNPFTKPCMMVQSPTWPDTTNFSLERAKLPWLDQLTWLINGSPIRGVSHTTLLRLFYLLHITTNTKYHTNTNNACSYL